MRKGERDFGLDFKLTLTCSLETCQFSPPLQENSHEYSSQICRFYSVSAPPAARPGGRPPVQSIHRYSNSYYWRHFWPWLIPRPRTAGSRREDSSRRAPSESAALHLS